jgi:hypothetical protein
MIRSIKTILAPAIVALAVLPGAASAATVRPQYSLVVGTLSSVTTGANGAIAIATPGGTTATIPVNTHTRFLARSSAAYKAGLKSGDQVAAYTVTTATGTAAVTVEYNLKPFGITTRLGGTITAASSGSLTLTTPTNSTYALTVSNKTRYTLDNHGLKAVAINLTNQPALVAAMYMTSGATTARFISLGLPARHLAGVALHGSISTQGVGSLAVTLHSGKTLQVTLPPGTLYVVDGTLVATAPTITSTEKVQVVAVKSAGGTYTASSVWVKTH